MEKEQLLNSLGSQARETLENAKQLALEKGGVLSPLHLLTAALEDVLAASLQVSPEQARFLQVCHHRLAARFPLQGRSITITRETQSIIAEAIELSRQDSSENVLPAHLLRAAMANAMVREAL